MPLVVLHKQEGCRWVQVWGGTAQQPLAHVARDSCTFPAVVRSAIGWRISGYH